MRANFIRVGYCGSVQSGGKEFVKVLFNSSVLSAHCLCCVVLYMTSSGRRIKVVSTLMFEWPKKIIAVCDRGKVRVFGFGI